MKYFLTSSLALASLAFVATSCSDNKTTTAETTTAPAATTAVAADSTAAPAATNGVATAYTCPMHPEVVTDHPGKCPKCGMNLIVKK
jgi:hypothetical protein